MSVFSPQQEIHELECLLNVNSHLSDLLISKSDKRLLSKLRLTFKKVLWEITNMHLKGEKVPTENQFLDLWYIYAYTCIRLKRIPLPFNIAALQKEWNTPTEKREIYVDTEHEHVNCTCYKIDGIIYYRMT